MRKILLYGNMRKRFGKCFELDVNTPAEAIHALMCVVEGFRSWFQEQARAGAEYHVFCGDRNIVKDNLELPAKDDEPIRVVPVVNGAKSGTLAKIAGIALIVVGVITANPYLIGGGAALLVGGIIADKMPKLGTINERDEAKPSSVFDGAVNTEAAGHPYPLLYGTVLCGSAVASAGLYTTEFPIEQP